VVGLGEAGAGSARGDVRARVARREARRVGRCIVLCGACASRASLEAGGCCVRIPGWGGHLWGFIYQASSQLLYER